MIQKQQDSKLSIVIPAYNEETSLSVVLPQIIGFCAENNFKLIIVNDGSTDKTGSLLSQYANEDIEIINHKINRGYGGALKSGIRNAQTTYVITIDADGQHNLSDVKNMLQQIEQNDADLGVGARPDARISIRFVGKRIIRFVARRLMTIPINDINSGMKIYRTELAKQYIDLCPDNMAFSDIIGLVFIYNKHCVFEQRISINNRIAGESKIRLLTAFETVMAIINIVVLFNPMRIFLPISIFLMFIGISWGFPFLLMGRGVSVGASLAIITSLIIFCIGLIAEQLSQIRKIRVYK